MAKVGSKCLYCNGTLVKDEPDNLKCNNIDCEAGERGYKRFKNSKP